MEHRRHVTAEISIQLIFTYPWSCDGISYFRIGSRDVRISPVPTRKRTELYILLTKWARLSLITSRRRKLSGAWSFSLLKNSCVKCTEQRWPRMSWQRSWKEDVTSMKVLKKERYLHKAQYSIHTQNLKNSPENRYKTFRRHLISMFILFSFFNFMLINNRCCTADYCMYVY